MQGASVNEERNVAIVRRYFDEVWNRGNLEAAEELVAPDFSVEGCGGAISGLEAVKLYVSSYRAAYPHVRFTMLSVIAEGAMVLACWMGQGLHSAACDSDEDAQNCTRRSSGLSIYRIQGGRIAEAWAGSDHVGAGRAERLGIRKKE
jgi:predicted SnoaL-like aldol condensation-catalyzing enzyme